MGQDLSLPVRGEWIEILENYFIGLRLASLPVRGEWIEIRVAKPIREQTACLSP